MIALRTLVLSVTTLAASGAASAAGPCSTDIDSVQARVDARLEAVAASGKTARESTRATMNRQPTPSSIATAEEQLGELSPRTVNAIRKGMTRARAADSAGNQRACRKALAAVQRALGPRTR